MKELLRTNDPVIISVVTSLLKDAHIAFMVADENMSILEGSLGVIPRRILIDKDRMSQARVLMHDAGLEAEMR